MRAWESYELEDEKIVMVVEAEDCMNRQSAKILAVYPEDVLLTRIFQEAKTCENNG